MFFLDNAGVLFYFSFKVSLNVFLSHFIWENFRNIFLNFKKEVVKQEIGDSPARIRQFVPESKKSTLGRDARFIVKEKQMDGILFLVFWLGCASLHTVFDLKVRPVLRAVREESDFS